MTVYSDDPLSVASDFEKCGAKYIHMVDLEGAKTEPPRTLTLWSGWQKHVSLCGKSAEG